MALERLRFIFGHREPQPPRYGTEYLCLTPDQIRNCNYPNIYLLKTTLNLTIAERKYGIDLQNIGMWGSTRYNLPIIRLDEMIEGERTDQDIRRFDSILGKIHVAVRPMGRMETTVGIGRGYDRSEAIIKVKPVLWKDNKPSRLSKDQVAGFIERLAAQGLKTNEWGLTWFRGMSWEELLACNLPRETWIMRATNLNSGQSFDLRNLAA